MEQTTVNRRYRVDRRIGEGGMAEVYLGHDLLLHRAVAIKALRAQYASDPHFRARFEREAQAAAGFTHPNIIDIYDVGEEHGTPYIVMEYVRGEALKEIVDQEGPFEPDDVAALLEQVCAALDYAHARGLVHRDVKPQNILVDDTGLAKVVDFGIAKGLADSHLTEAGTGIGTVHYISPEQASGLMATPSSDIYSIGVVAFEMLTRTLPFEADSAVGVAMRHVRDDPPRPSSIKPRIPGAVDAIVVRALEKDPTKRYPSAGDFAAAMTEWRGYRPGGPNPATAAAHRTAPQRRERVPAPHPAATAAATAAVSAPRAAVAAPPGGQAEPVRRPAMPAARPAASSPVPAGRPVVTSTNPRRDDVGCGTWVAGITVLVALVALIWLGARFSSGFPAFGAGENATRSPTDQAEAPAPEATTVPAPEEPTAPIPTPTPPITEAVTVPAPDLIGLDLVQARDEAASLGLLIQEGDSVFDEAIPADYVAEQDPPAGTDVTQGESVLVKLSQGSAAVDLVALDLVGQTPEAATEVLEARGLGVQREETGSTDVAEGLVAAVSPPTSSTVGETVTLYVSVGDAVLIPIEVFGQPVDAVADQLAAAGLRVADRTPVDRERVEAGEVDLATDAIADGDVVGVQDARGDANFGAWVPRGTEVTLVYYDESLGPA